MRTTVQFLLVSEAARCLDVTAGTVRNWIEAGTLRAKRHPVNGYRMILKVDIDALAREIQALPTRAKGRPAKSRRKPA